MSCGELYTIVTSKQSKGKKGCLVAIVKGTKSDTVIGYLRRITSSIRLNVKEITLDMSGSMKEIARRVFPNATQVIDRFHVQCLASEALQDLRIQHRWRALEKENKEIRLARKNGQMHQESLLPNGETRKQLLARSRHLLFKAASSFTDSQKERADILFEQYPDIKMGYDLVSKLRHIYNMKIDKTVAMTK